MLAKNLKKGMLVGPGAGHVIVIRSFPHKPPGVEEGELGFTVVRDSAVKFVKLVANAPTILSADSPVMYYDTVKVKAKRKKFTFNIYM